MIRGRKMTAVYFPDWNNVHEIKRLFVAHVRRGKCVILFCGIIIKTFQFIVCKEKCSGTPRQFSVSVAVIRVIQGTGVGDGSVATK